MQIVNDGTKKKKKKRYKTMTTTTTINVTSASIPATFVLTVHDITPSTADNTIWYAVCRGWTCHDASGRVYYDFDADYGNGSCDAAVATKMAMDLFDDADAVRIVTMRVDTDDAIDAYTITPTDVDCDCTTVQYVYVRADDVGGTDIYRPENIITVAFGGGYTFRDYLHDNNVDYTQDDNDDDIYYVDDATGKYAYVIYDVHPTTIAEAKKNNFDN